MRSLFFFERHDRDIVIGAALGTDATADATICNVDLAAGQAGDTCTATQHANGVLALPASCSDADVADDHALTIHTRVAVAPGAGLFAFVAMDAQVKVYDEHFCALDHATSDEFTQPGARLGIGERIDGFRTCMREGVEEARLRGSSGITILLQAHSKTLVDLGIAREEGQERLARDFCHACARNGSNRNSTSIAEQIKSTSEVISTLAIGDDALIGLIAASARGSTACHLGEALEQDVHRLADRRAHKGGGITCPPDTVSRPCILGATLAEEDFVAVVAFDLCLFCNLPYIYGRDALEQGHTLEDCLDGASIIQLLKEVAYCRHDLHQTLHDLFRHFFAVRPRGGKLEAALQDEADAATKLTFAHYYCPRHE